MEWKALMDFKGSLVDEESRLSSWTGSDCCSWYGITCHNRTGFVQMLDLKDMHGLGGQINSSLLRLEHLEYLDLSYNDFSGIPIPAFFGSLKNLRYLNMYMTGISGEIPHHLGNLSNLQHLSLGGLTFGYSPTRLLSLSSNSFNWITGLSSLRSLKLSYVNASKSVDWLDSINMLSSLSSLTLDSCGLVGMALSRDLNLTSLVSIRVFGNNFNADLFPNFFSISSLDSALPPSLFNLSSLNEISFVECDLRGPIPDMFQKLTALNRLDLSYNSIESSLSHSLCTLRGLTRLNLGMNELHGSIPSCIGNMSNLSWLQLETNDISGAIPDQLGFLTQLTFLELGQNQLSGKIPSTLGELTKLEKLSFFQNSLTGELSESFFEGMKSLEHLEFSRNQYIALNVTSQWNPPLKIRTLRLDSVFIGSPFPAWLQTQVNLTELTWRNASLYGVIPGWCQTSYPRLSYINLSNNFLAGPIPTFTEINTATVTDLVLSYNQLTGEIPDELCNLRSMRLLKLANNQLIGRIPSCLGNLRDLQVLDLANNSFSGYIPNELGYLNQLVLLRLNGNKLFGELPSSFQNLTLLRTLDLGKNELEGVIPSWIGKELIHLEHIMLQSNKFSGEISVNLCQLSSLQILNLPDNNLVGIIPPCLGNLSMMQSNNSAIEFNSNTFLTITVKGIELEYSSNLPYAKFISLSGNHLHGEIPVELMELTELQSLNLSNNWLTGMIPKRIGNMKHLESLDLSMNQLYGIIPQSLVDIDDLEYLKLSFNNLSGKIPSGGHFDTFDDPSVYEGNGELCGKPTAKRCVDDDDLGQSEQNGPVTHGDGKFEIEWVYAGIGPGFAVGFLGVFCLLYFEFIDIWRFLENVYIRF